MTLAESLCRYNTGPTPTLLSGRRLYRAMELFVPPFTWGKDYRAMAVHADANADLMDAARCGRSCCCSYSCPCCCSCLCADSSAPSWTTSEPLALNTSWPGFRELLKAPMEVPGYLEVHKDRCSCCLHKDPCSCCLHKDPCSCCLHKDPCSCC